MLSFRDYIILNLDENLVKTEFKGRNVLFHATWYQALENILDEDRLEGRSIQIRQATGTIDKELDKDIADVDWETYFRKLNGKKVKGISFSRNWNFNFQGADVQIILDGEKLKRKFGKKIAPIDYFGNHENHKEWGDDFPVYMKKWDKKRPKDSVESEEFLAIENLIGLHNYILGFIINDKIENSDPKNVINEISEYITEYAHRYRLYNLPIYWQNGTLKEIVEQK